MIKNVKWFFVVLISCSLLSLSFVEKRVSTEKLAIGDKAPTLVFRQNMQPLNLHRASGTYTLLSFWASYDARSRTQNAQLGYWAKRNPRLHMVSVSFDTLNSIYEASVKNDHLDAVSCYRAEEGEHSDIFRSYGLNSGFKNYLLDSNGVIIARNVTPDKLERLLN